MNTCVFKTSFLIFAFYFSSVGIALIGALFYYRKSLSPIQKTAFSILALSMLTIVFFEYYKEGYAGITNAYPIEIFLAALLVIELGVFTVLTFIDVFKR